MYMNNIVSILMNRDNISEEDAISLIKETCDEIIMLDDPCKADEVIMDYLNLESDYIYEILDI